MFGRILAGNNLRASPPATGPLAAGLAFSYQWHIFMSLAADLQALQYSDRLDGLLACGLLLFFVWLIVFVGMCAGSLGFSMLALDSFFELGSQFSV